MSSNLAAPTRITPNQAQREFDEIRMSKADDRQTLQRAFSLHQRGNLSEAANLYRQLIKSDPNNFHALHYLGVIEAGTGNFEQAKLLMARSLSIQPPNIQFIENYAAILFQTADYESALHLCLQGLQLNDNNVSLLYVSAISLFKLNQLQESLAQFDKVLLCQPNHIIALNERGSVLATLKQYDAALASIEKALAINPQYAEAHLNKGNLCGELERYDLAIAAYDNALTISPNLANAWLGRGNIFRKLKRHDEALAAYDTALALRPDFAEAWLGRGNVFSDLKRHDDALAAYDKARVLRPDLAEAALGRGNVFLELKRHEDALAAYDKALALWPDLALAYLGRGNVFSDLKRHEDALAAYDKALAIKPDLPEACFGLGSILLHRKSHDDALAAFDKALTLKNDFAEAWLGRGYVFRNLKRYDDALAAYDKALALKPDFAEAWLSRGNVLSDLRRHGEAFAAFDKALPRLPDLAEAARMHAKMRLCDWTDFDAESQHLISSVRNGLATSPFPLLAIATSPDDLVKSAQQHCAADFPPSDKPIWQGERYSHDRIRVAYISADFYRHPVAYLIAGVFEQHDKSRFEITGISVGPDDNSEIRERIKTSFGRFIDAATQSDEQIAELVKPLEIDVLVDLQGFTAGARTSIFARRPAPVQVNYLGYLGTMGAPYIDYLIADQIMIPNNQYEFYSEKVAVLPYSFLPNDRERRIADKNFTRAEVGLPQEGLVFCCFNNNYKITPDIYDIWMRILDQVDGSVLWLVGEGPTMERNLKSETAARGVATERLIFAPRLPLPEHQARIRLADLFLDTLPYNAGATASDALWAGLPVLTRKGDTFAGRMAASQLNAIGLAELVTTTPQEYETVAVRLATHPDQLAKIKQKLADNRLTTPLFDTKLYTRHLEAAYTAMHERHQAGLAPDHIYISN